MISRGQGLLVRTSIDLLIAYCLKIKYYMLYYFIILSFIDEFVNFYQSKSKRSIRFLFGIGKPVISINSKFKNRLIKDQRVKNKKNLLCVAENGHWTSKTLIRILF